MLHIDKKSVPALFSSDGFTTSKDKFLLGIRNNENPNFQLLNRFMKEIRKLLQYESGNRCVYCERKLGLSSSSGDVDHFYPKFKYPERAFEWDNLFLSCHDCNRLKGSYDPNINRHLSILNPATDDINNLLIESESGILIGKNPQAIKTIELFELNSEDLIRMRLENKQLNHSDVYSSITVSSGVQLAHYHSDQDFEDDLLNIQDDVEAFARLINMREVDNMAIGLFGSWGAGKSFFMKNIKKSITKLTNIKEKENAIFHSRVVQIEFNAWHYMDTNLYASLANHIFNQIHSYYAKAKKDSSELFNSLPSVKEKSEELKRLNQKKIEQLEVLESKTFSASLMDFIKGNKKENDFIDTLAPGEGLVRNATAWKTRGDEFLFSLQETATKLKLIYKFIPRKVWIWGAIIPLIIMVLGYLFSFLQPKIWNSSFLWLSSFIGSISYFVKQVYQNPKVRAVRNHWSRIFEKLADEAKLKENQQAELNRINEDMQVIQNELDEIKSGKIIQHYLDERIRSNAYNKELGIINVLRDDFEMLSEYMHSAKGEKYGIDRIILYIDDLDRCKPQQVIEVLQAVHLILSAKIFMVIVAVDIRWVTRCLQEEYKVSLEIDDTNSNATAYDYLEKIFQITYQISPLSEADGRSYLEGLLKVGNKVSQAETSVDPVQLTSEENSTGDLHLENQKGGESVEENRQVDESKLLEYSRLHLGEGEIKYILEFVPLLGTSPRTMKRFVNSYRLIRVRYYDDFDRGAILFLLALETGYPSLSDALRREFDRQVNADRTISEILEDFTTNNNGRPFGIIKVRDFIKNRYIGDLTVAQLHKSAVRVSRYSFYMSEETITA